MHCKKHALKMPGKEKTGAVGVRAHQITGKVSAHQDKKQSGALAGF